MPSIVTRFGEVSPLWQSFWQFYGLFRIWQIVTTYFRNILIILGKFPLLSMDKYGKNYGFWSRCSLPLLPCFKSRLQEPLVGIINQQAFDLPL